MRVNTLSLPGSANRPNEDAVAVAADCVVVADGATARTETGCVHGVSWFARQLVDAVVEHCGDPSVALRAAITQTAESHRETCDLTDPATPGAAIAVVAASADVVRFLVLGDVTVVVDGDEPAVVVDDRVSHTALAERAIADALPQGSAEKAAALVVMKRAELAARNVPGGFWTAAADPSAVGHAITGTLPRAEVGRVAVLTDGAARAVDPFALLSWSELLDLLESGGPADVLSLVRAAELSDPAGERWTRNKTSDDATIAYLDLR